MVDFTLTDEQIALREMAHDFAEKEIRPVAWEFDKDGTWPQAILEKAWELGLMNAHIPEEYGGPGVSYLEGALIEEELCWGCSGIGTSIGANGLATAPLALGGSRGAQAEVPRDADRGAAVRVLLPDRARRRLRRLRACARPPSARATSGSSTARSASSPTAATRPSSRSTPRPTRRRATAASPASSCPRTTRSRWTRRKTRWASGPPTPRPSPSTTPRSRSIT